MKLGELTKHYFDNNQQKLEKNYPGISLERLKNELFDLYRPDYLDRKEFFSTPYNAINFHLIDAFFLSLTRGVPLEYISGKKYFYRSEFHVNSDVLIPRSETEILVEKSVEMLKEWRKKTDERLKVCDVGTGSGCIILSVLKEYQWPLKATASDISEKALKVAQENFFRLRFGIHPNSECHFIKSDRLNNVEEKFHLIMSNPPYIKEQGDQSMVHQQVFEYEPHLALFLKDGDYQKWFEDFFSDAYSKLLEEGILFMEGHENHLKDLLNLANKNNWTSSEIIKDYCDRDRFLVLRK